MPGHAGRRGFTRQKEPIQPMITDHTAAPTAVQQAAVADRDALLAPCFLMRMTGLPLSALDALSFPNTVALIEEILAIESEQAHIRDALLTELRAHAEHFTDKSLQHKGLDLRRAIAAGNGKKALTLLNTIAPHLPEALAREIRQSCERAMRRLDLLAAGDATLRAELTHCRATLRKALRDEEFQRGLLLSSSTLYSELQYYLSTPPDKMNNRLRRAEEGLLSYLVRMAAKTSPFSTFTSTALGFWRDDDTQALRVDLPERQPRSVVRFHTAVMSGILRTLSLRSEIRPHLRPRRNTTIRVDEDGERITYFAYDLVPMGSSGRHNERIVRLKLDAIKRALFDAIARSDAQLTYAELVEQVSAVLPAPAELVTEALEKLAHHSAVAIKFAIPDNEDDQLGALVAALANIPGAWVAGVHAAYAELYALVNAVADAAPPDRERLLAEIQQRTRAISRAIGHIQPDTPEDLIDKRFHDLVLEDTVLAPRRLTLARNAWQPLLDDLRALQQFAPILDETIVDQLIVGGLSELASGVESGAMAGDLVDYYARFNTARAHAREVTANRLSMIRPLLRDLYDARSRFTTMLDHWVSGAAQCGARTLTLAPADIQRLTATFPDFLQRDYSIAYFGQLFQQDADHQMVVNLSWSGPGPAFSRFGYLLSALDTRRADAPNASFIETVRGYITELGKRRGVAYAALVETAGINVNIHGPMTPLEIVYPNNISAQPADKVLTLRDLSVYHDPKTHELRFFAPRLGQSISPLHMGFAVLDRMPQLYQMMIFTTHHYVDFDLIARIEARLAPEQKERVRHYPRINVGHVVVNRESWKIPQPLLPQREADDSDFQYFLKLNRWRVAHELPVEGFSRVFSRYERGVMRLDARLEGLLGITRSSVSVDTADQIAADPTPSSAADAGVSSGDNFGRVLRIAENDTIRKPLYVNFHNFLFLSLFTRAVRAVEEGQSLTFEEMLPARDQQLVRPDGEARVSEFVIELSLTEQAQ